MTPATVVVPSRDRPEDLARCLDALAAQSVPSPVVVVDDASVDRAAVERVCGVREQVRLVRGDGRGPAAARNLGAAHVGTGIVCFTDDDCRPGPRWVEAILARFGEGADAVAGPTRNVGPGPFAAASQAITNHLVTVDLVDGHVAFAPTSNLAVAVDRFAPFDESFPLAAGEDRAWCEGWRAAGRSIAWAPAAWVDHHQALSWRRFWRQQSRYGRGAHQLRAVGGGRLRPARFYLGLVRAGLADGPLVGAAVVAGQVATAAGVAAARLGR